MPDGPNRCVRATPMSAGTSGDAQEHEVSALNHRLAELIAQYDQAEGDFLCAADRCHSPDFKASIADDRLSEAERDALILERERTTGLDTASDRSDFAYAQVLAFADEVLKLSSTAPAMLGLKARVCLWERSVEQMRHEGCVRAAEFLAQLATLS